MKQLSIFFLIYVLNNCKCGRICNTLVLTSRLTMKIPESYTYLLVNSVTAMNLTDCASTSALTWNCASFFYQEANNTCLMYKSKMSALTLKTESGWVGFEFQGRPMPEVTSACESTNGYTFNSDAHMCYRVQKTPTVTWQDAVNACKSEGGIMVKLNTTEKKRVLEGYLSPVHNKYFLGATDTIVDGVWRWESDDTVVTWLDKTGSDDCMRMKLDTDNSVVYDDDECDDMNGFFCEIFV
ncbi:uncharacterized protein LOC124292277 [Haliotis rubra]|uniref:uncharacterized protein LOC124292277 n=1 Tax=Haliotis rubra TaxID=36100 RepID=UPI001EE6311B|nr:uncharacterized protein LOC124292277 [Haliotis rubra]